MIRILHESSDVTLAQATAHGDALWMNADEIEQATGWTCKPEGLCRDDNCMPLPRRTDAPMFDGERLDVAAFWRHAGWPVVHDAASHLWVLGEGAARRSDALVSLQAPDFELPDLDGHLHRLSDHRGRRVFLATWASW